MEYRASTTGYGISEQFPDFYREDAPDFVEFVKEYYEFLDSQNERNISRIRDIDETLEGFLVYYKRKYLADLPFVNFQDTDIPFLVKHITDLYNRKGTQEALQLLFRMFFKQDVEIYLPASSILKLSDSKYTFNVFIEFIPVSKISDFPIKKGDAIEGDTSKATAFVDEVVFYNINGALTPVAYISNVYGRFITDDGLKVTRAGSVFYPGKLIYGSIATTEIQAAGNRAGNKVGDRVDLVSSNFGVDAEAVITEVSETPSGVVDWQLVEGGWGYSTTKEDNIIYKSTQVLVVKGDEQVIKPFDTLQAIQVPITDADPANPISAADRGQALEYFGSGTVIAYEHPVIFVQTEPRDILVYQDGAFVAVRLNEADDENPAGFRQIIDFPNAGETQVTLTRIADGGTVTIPIETQAEYNNTAAFDIAQFGNLETVDLITDVVGDYLTVRLDASNYGMSGPTAETITTPIKDAFEVETFELGSIDRLRILDSGLNYKNNVRTIIRQPDIYNFNYGLIGLKFDRTDFIITTDDVLEQVIRVQDLTYDTVTNPDGYVDYTVRGQFIRREGNVFFFKPLTFYQFKRGVNVTFRGRELQVLAITERAEYISGGNANVTGTAEFLVGQVKTISMLKSGFRYRTGEIVSLVNQETNKEVARAKLNVDGMGQTEGGWVTTTSHLNDNNRFIHDNDFYQEYSYEVSSILDPDVYEKVVKDTVHVAGTKLFSSPLINTLNNVRPTADVAIEAYDLTAIPFVTEDGGIILSSIVYFLLGGSVGLTGTSPSTGANWTNMYNLLTTDDGTGRILGDLTDSGVAQPGDASSSGSAFAMLRYVANGTSGDAEDDARIVMLIDAINNDVSIRNDTYDNGGQTYYIWDNDGANTMITEAGDELAAVIVNFGDVDVPFEVGNSSLSLVGTTDRSLDTFDETIPTMDLDVLTFDRT